MEKNKIVSRFRHEQMLLPAVAQPQPGCTAGTDRIQALDRLVAISQGICKRVYPGTETAGSIGHQIRHCHHRRTDRPCAACPRKQKPLQPRPPYKHQHSPDPQYQHRTGKVRLQQHQRRHRAQYQNKGQHPYGKPLHPVLVQGYDMGKHKHHRAFCDLAGLQRPQPRQHQPPLAAVILRHEQHRYQQEQRYPSSGQANLW